jgi:hypothetical protein
MNLFKIVTCVDLREEMPEELKDVTTSSNGPVIIMNNIDWPSTFLFFPVQDENMEFINNVMNGEEEPESLSLYKTMMDSWKSNGNFLSGIVCDVHFEPKEDSSPKITLDLALSDSEGMLISMVPVSLFDAAIISIIKDMEFVITERFLNTLIPNASGEEELADFPEDHNIESIVKDILDAPVKDDGADKEE